MSFVRGRVVGGDDGRRVEGEASSESYGRPTRPELGRRSEGRSRRITSTYRVSSTSFHRRTLLRPGLCSLSLPSCLSPQFFRPFSVSFFPVSLSSSTPSLSVFRHLCVSNSSFGLLRSLSLSRLSCLCLHVYLVLLPRLVLLLDPLLPLQTGPPHSPDDVTWKEVSEVPCTLWEGRSGKERNT